MIEDRRSQVQDLFKKRDHIQKELDRLDVEIQRAANLDAPLRRRRRAGRRRIKNETSLRSVVLQILGKNKKGFPLSELAEKVQEAGYKSGSQNFKNVVYQCVYHTPEIALDSATGCYRIKR
jgi:hypothetical protein